MRLFKAKLFFSTFNAKFRFHDMAGNKIHTVQAIFMQNRAMMARVETEASGVFKEFEIRGFCILEPGYSRQTIC